MGLPYVPTLTPQTTTPTDRQSYGSPTGSPRLVVSGDEVTKGVGKQPSTLVEANRTVQTLVGTRRCGHTGPMRIE